MIEEHLALTILVAYKCFNIAVKGAGKGVAEAYFTFALFMIEGNASFQELCMK